MRGPWNRAQCAGLLLVAVLGQHDMAFAAHDPRWKIHELARQHPITSAAVHLYKREPTCKENHTLCPAEQGGGCCPTGYTCSGQSCVATTGGVSTGCGGSSVGYYDCPIDRSPGNCCPQGYICPDGGGDCFPANGEYTCPTGSSACPESLGFGCCQNGLACGKGYCYNTEPSTFPFTSTITTTNSRGNTITSTLMDVTVFTPTSQATDQSWGPYVSVTSSGTIPQVVAQETDPGNAGGGSNGLSSGELGGIIAGVVILLIAIVAAAWFVIRRLKRAEKAAERAASSKQDSSSGGHHHRRHQNARSSTKSGFEPPSVSEVDGFDPLTYTRRGRSSTANSSPHRRRDRTTSDTSGVFPPYNHPSPDPSRAGPSVNRSGRSSPAWPGQYNPVPLTEADSRPHSVDSIRDGRNSYDVRNSQQSSNLNYHSSSAAGHRFSHDSSVSGVTTTAQGRHLSYSSELESSHGASELHTEDGEAAARRRSSSGTSVTQFRRSSDGPVSPYNNTFNNTSGANGGTARGRTESSAAAHALSTVNEMAEALPAQIPGFYGPSNTMAGQTDAGKDDWLQPVPRRESSVSPTPTEAYHPKRG